MTSQKRATGYGNAKKPDMQAAAERRWGVKMGETKRRRRGQALTRWTSIYSDSGQEKAPA
ncbi:hypothetical protein ACVW1A_007843 [Bradyrhizobium sp. LB1.3]|jgi:hypothetical protein